MKFQDEYRDPAAAARLQRAIAATATRPWTIMEVCGGQTHSIVRYGLSELLPPSIELVHGPGCPVCVTPLETIDLAIEIASQPAVIFCSFGDMLRVPGSRRDLFDVKAMGGDVRIVYSPLDAVRLAEQHPHKTVVFFAVGFETTAPANAMAILEAKRRGLFNFAALVSHVLVPPAMTAILSAPACRVQGFLGAGHVCTVTGYTEYEPIAAKFRVPIVVTGFEPVDLLEGIYRCVAMLEEGRIGVENQYARAVKRIGNSAACATVASVFEVADRNWRGIGVIPQSGYRLRREFHAFDAERRFTKVSLPVVEPNVCMSGAILQGLKKPHDCPAFGKICTPENPLGATMVSSEGACAAYVHYRQRAEPRSIASPSA